jgi:penicillin-binding protein 2
MDNFSEHLIRESTNRGSYVVKASPRIYILVFSLFIVFAILFLRVFFLQIIKGDYFRILSDQNRTKTITINAPRGIMFDRNNNPLVFNEPGYRLVDGDETKLLTHDQALSILSDPENKLEVDSLRNYPYREAMSHVLGYIGQISESQLKSPLFEGYDGEDWVGKEGIEAAYEQRLKGIDGKRLLEVDATGKTLRSLGQDEPIPGEDITLTLDLKLQQKTFEAMKNIKKGAAIVSKPNGEILSIVSNPSFDPNLFTMGEAFKSATSSGYQKVEQVLLDAENQPLLNRAISGVYPPGSTFKIVVASAALKTGIINEAYSVEDTGVLRVGAFSYSNWYFTGYGGTDGVVNVEKGIARSNDIFFYKLAEKMGVSNISKGAKEFGVGSILGIDLLGEASGILPNEAWKKENIGEGWYLGDTFHYGIGQGFLLTTPLQVNAWTQAIANQGKLMQPHLLLERKSEVVRDSALDEKTFDLVRKGMIESCAPGGVAWPFYDFKVKNSKLKIDGRNFLEVKGASGSAETRQVVVACKTGTAEHGDTTGTPHAWITLFAPAYNPEVVVTVLAEESGEGSSIAGPIAKEILEEFFSN